MLWQALVDEDLDKEALDLGLEDNKLIEDLDLGIENHKMIDKCLNLLQSQFGEEDEGDKESEETKERIKEITEKIALENLDEGNKIDKSEKEGDNNDAEKGDGNEDYHLREFPAPPPGNYREIADCGEAIKPFVVVGGTAKSNQRKGDP
ncbi:hypothetical protein MJO28_015325 [Puccinia striiformis f. sp. tritici]|uniref:Uncharacterized protein n=1 Tax=Puccinia striiformis f. sp. tritici TaxID=168172 RepID=A0ACC0DS78_9BASI|nr:hypothetical protein MJO28_015325 [Puccinia striiformis f. sp. tritici]